MSAAVAAPIAGAVIGGVLSNRAASKQAAAMNAQAAAQAETARLAAEEARFRPVGITTRFATATPQFTGGRLTGYTTQASPELQELQARISGLYGGVGGSLAQAERAAQFQPTLEAAGTGLFNLGQQFIPTGTTPTLTGLEQEQLGAATGIGRQLLGDMTTAPSADVLEQQARLRGLAGQVTPTSYDPSARARGIFEEEMALLQPERRRTEQRLAATTFGRGRGGLSVGAEGQPELFGLGQAYAEQEARAAADAKQRARAELLQDIGMGTQLGQQAITTGQAGEQYRLGQLGQGINLLGQGGSIEELARQRMLQNIQTGAGLYTQGAGLFGTGYGLQSAALGPFQTQIQTQQGLVGEELRPIEVGSALGAQQSTSGARAGGMLMGGLGAAGELQAQAATARASGLAATGQAIAGLGQQYAAQQQQNKAFNDWLNRAYPQTPAPIESRPVGMMSSPRGIDLLGGQYGFSSGFPYI